VTVNLFISIGWAIFDGAFFNKKRKAQEIKVDVKGIVNSFESFVVMDSWFEVSRRFFEF